MNDAIFPKKIWLDFQPEPTSVLISEADKYFADAKGSKSKPLVSEHSSARTFLVVDSIKEGNNLIGFLLKKLGYEFEIVDTAEAALSKLRCGRYGLIFLDLNLFGNETLQTARSINRLNKSLGLHIPVIGMQSHSLERLVFVEDGINGSIYKASLADLIDIIDSFVETASDSQFGEFESPPAVLNSTTDMAFAQNQVVVREFEDSLLSGKIKTLLSCLKLATEEKNVESVFFLADSLRGYCRRVGLLSINQTIVHLVSETKAGRWLPVSTLMRVLEAQCKVAIACLES